MTQSRLAELAHVSPSAINKLEVGARGLDQQWMQRLAPHLGVTPAELLPDSDNPDRLASDEREIIERLRSSDAQVRRMALAMLRSLAELGEEDTPDHAGTVDTPKVA